MKTKINDQDILDSQSYKRMLEKFNKITHKTDVSKTFDILTEIEESLGKLQKELNIDSKDSLESDVVRLLTEKNKYIRYTWQKRISELFEIEKKVILKPTTDVIIAFGDMIINQINTIKNTTQKPVQILMLKSIWLSEDDLAKIKKINKESDDKKFNSEVIKEFWDKIRSNFDDKFEHMWLSYTIPEIVNVSRIFGVNWYLGTNLSHLLITWKYNKAREEILQKTRKINENYKKDESKRIRDMLKDEIKKANIEKIDPNNFSSNFNDRIVNRIEKLLWVKELPKNMLTFLTRIWFFPISKDFKYFLACIYSDDDKFVINIDGKNCSPKEVIYIFESKNPISDWPAGKFFSMPTVEWKKSMNETFTKNKENNVTKKQTKANLGRNNIKQYDIDEIAKLIWENQITEPIYKQLQKTNKDKLPGNIYDLSAIFGWNSNIQSMDYLNALIKWDKDNAKKYKDIYIKSIQNSTKYTVVIEKLKEAIKIGKITREDIQNRPSKYEEIKTILWNINNIPKSIRTIYAHTKLYISTISSDNDIDYSIDTIIDAIMNNSQ